MMICMTITAWYRAPPLSMPPRERRRQRTMRRSRPAQSSHRAAAGARAAVGQVELGGGDVAAAVERLGDAVQGIAGEIAECPARTDPHCGGQAGGAEVLGQPGGLSSSRSLRA